SFLVRYLTELGLDTHLSRRSENAAWDENAQAGLEDLPLVSDPADLPYVVKTPWITEYIDQILAHKDFTIDVAVVPMRDLITAAASRTIVELRAIYERAPWVAQLEACWDTWGWTPGGTVYSLDALDQARILAVAFHRLLDRLVRADVPIVLLAFPRFIADPDYLYTKLKPFLPAQVTIEQARDAHERLADQDKIRTEREIDADTVVELDALPHNTRGPSHRDLDRVALQRELERLRKEHKQLTDEMTALRAAVSSRPKQV
ncbi:MAG: hypothetical protein Q7R41_06970, partial [Phycisphaerales bacterium]|nr:hypothetical protein [Phycisphaerales bacterium]